MWILMLNDMRAAQIEILTPVAKAETREELEQLLQREQVRKYSDDAGNGRRWHKSHRPGGPLEWYNPPYKFNMYEHLHDIGTAEDWANEARERYAQHTSGIPQAGEL